jgi:hypothetical protein
MTDELTLFDKDDDDFASEWALFQAQFNLPLNKTSLLALVSDIVKNKSFMQRQKFHRLLKSHLDTLDTEYGLDQILSSKDELLQANTLSIFFDSTKMLIERAELDLETLIESNKSDSEVFRTIIDRGHFVLDQVIRFQHILWRPNRGKDWSLPPTSLEVSKQEH